MIASPENSAAPATPRKNTGSERRPSACCAKAMRDSVPPSPLLSARIRNSTYFAVTVNTSAQSSSDTVPITASSESPCDFECARDSRKA